MRQLTALFVVAVAIAMAAPARAQKYEMADLLALEKSGGWHELVDHLGDILPSKRDAAWTALAERAAAAQLAAIPMEESHAEEVFATSDSILKRYPQLKQSKAFMAKRAELSLKAFGFTYGHYHHSAGDDKWLDQIKEFVKSDTLTANLPQDAARKVQAQLVAYCAWPLWKTAIDKGADVCKDPDFQKSIISAFEDALWKDEIKTVADKKCWADLKAPLQASLAKSNNDNFKDLLCPVLKAKGIKLPKCDEE